MTNTINRQKALDLVRDVCIDVMDSCKTRVDEDGEEIYENMREVNAILTCNKRIRWGIMQLPSYGDPEEFDFDEMAQRFTQIIHNLDDMKLLLSKKTGHWVHQDRNERHGMMKTCVYYMPTCSECGKTGSDQYRYCPHCGADMRGEE